MTALFLPCTVFYGGKAARGLAITCGKCGREERQHFAVMQQSGKDDDNIVERLATRKFEGWKIGKSPGQHRCPDCVARAAQMRYVHAEKEGITPMLTTTPPREMSRTDRRLIFAKLEEAYGDEKTDYQRDWTDDRVAKDLGTPVAWVRLVREENFGPLATNPEIDRVLDEARKWRADVLTLVERTTTLLAESRKLGTRGEDIERRIATIQKAIGK